MMKFKLIDLIDIDKNQSLLNSFCDVVGIAAAIIDLEGEVLVGSRWQRICTDFHRVNERTCEKCIESDTQLANELQQGKRFSIYRCRNGLTDAASPIVIEGKHLANVFVGQFLLEPPDLEFFRRQAVAYRFEENAYLDALSEVPIVGEKNLPAILDFLTTFAEMVVMMGIEQLRQIEAEEALRESEERYRTIIERSPVGLFIVQDRKFQLINPQFLKLTGYSEDDFLGVDSLAFVLPEDRDVVNENTIKMLKKGFSLPFEFRVINKSGEIRWVELTVTSIQYQKRRAVLGYYVDINESKQAREEIAKRQKYMESVVNSAPDAIVTLDASHNIIEWNPGAERLFGYTRDEVVGKDIDDLISLPDMKHELKALTKHILSGEMVLSHETVRYRNDGTPVNVIVAGSPIEIEGKFFGAVAVYTDITERKKLESQLRQAQKMEAIGTLAGGIAHDFNNILAAIIGYAGLAKVKAPEDSRLLSDLDQILKSSSRATTLVQQILAFSRKQGLEQKPLQLKYIVKETLKLLRSTLPTDIEIKEYIAKDVGIINADPTQMHQVVMNLCINAGHAMQEGGGVLEVNLQNVDFGLGITDFKDEESRSKIGLDPGPYLRLTVRDTGHGMSSELLERIFDPYFTTKEKEVGTGMGLSVVNGIVNSYGGTIMVESEPGKGSTFHVYLPLIQEEAIKPEMDEQAPILTGNERILFIDDELALVDIGKQMLKHFGYEVTSRTSSIEALELFRTKPDQFDLVITDMTMPNMTGDRLAKELIQIRPDIPIILCTGFSERVSEKKVKGMGIKAFAMKPLVIQYLAKTVRKVLEEN